MHRVSVEVLNIHVDVGDDSIASGIGVQVFHTVISQLLEGIEAADDIVERILRRKAEVQIFQKNKLPRLEYCIESRQFVWSIKNNYLRMP